MFPFLLRIEESKFILICESAGLSNISKSSSLVLYGLSGMSYYYNFKKYIILHCFFTITVICFQVLKSIWRIFCFDKFGSLQQVKILFSTAFIRILFKVDLPCFYQKILYLTYHPFICYSKNFKICFKHDFQGQQLPQKICSNYSAVYQMKNDLHHLNCLKLTDLRLKPHSFSKVRNDYFHFCARFFSFSSLMNCYIS